MPVKWLEAFVDMLEPLQAERTLNLIAAYSLGSPSGDKAGRRYKQKAINDLKRSAKSTSTGTAGAEHQAERQHQPARLVSMGLGYKRLKG